MLTTGKPSWECGVREEEHRESCLGPGPAGPVASRLGPGTTTQPPHPPHPPDNQMEEMGPFGAGDLTLPPIRVPKASPLPWPKWCSAPWLAWHGLMDVCMGGESLGQGP